MIDILKNKDFIKVELINKGWSKDKKYYVETKTGERLLIRISDISDFDDKKYEFLLMEKMAALGIKMSKPIKIGICNEGRSVYQILTWCEGQEAKEVLPLLSEEEQYKFGWEAGQVLLKMQTIENYPSSSDWYNFYKKKIEKYIENYKNCGRKLENDELFISFLEKHISCIKNRPMSLLHSDFQSDNMVISPNSELYIIDFQGSSIVDPYYTLTGVMVTAEVSPQFSIGQLHSYFGGSVPDDFWELNAFYMIAESINAFTVAVTLGEEEIEYSNEMSKMMLNWFSNLRTFIPNWYLEKN